MKGLSLKTIFLNFNVALVLIFLIVSYFSLFLNIHGSIAQEGSSTEKVSLTNDVTDKRNGVDSDRRIKSERGENSNQFEVTFYRPNYFLPLTYYSNPSKEAYFQANNDLPINYEIKFQLSLKMLFWDNIFKGNGDLYGSYTHLSLWQIYNESSPFRESNYEPELFLKFDTDFNVFGLHNDFFILGVNHQSNGCGGDLSRSWNRFYIEFIAKKDNFLVALRPWYRIPENDETDGNPDIDRYLGYGQLWGAYKWEKHVLSFAFRNNLRFDENKGSIEIGWSYPLANNLRVYLQYFNGYGESLIDYNHLTNRIGCGFMINDWI
jgi:phospholipase A1